MFSSLTVFGIHWLCLFIKMRVWVFFPPLFCHTCHRASGKPCIQLSQGLTGKCEESSAPPPSVSVHQAANSDYHTVLWACTSSVVLLGLSSCKVPQTGLFACKAVDLLPAAQRSSCSAVTGH